MSQLSEDLRIYPQVLVNVRVKDKAAAQADPDVQAAVKKAADALGDTGADSGAGIRHGAGDSRHGGSGDRRNLQIPCRSCGRRD